MAQPTSDHLHRRPRFGEATKLVPICLVIFVISTEWIIYMLCHLMPLWQFDRTAPHVNRADQDRGIFQTIVFNCLTTMLVACYVRCVLVHPGHVPDTEEWEYIPTDGLKSTTPAGVNIQESKKSGDRRYCKWCGKYKPDRCHHCRICRMCILKMDHHCPWIYNCVGFHNYKYFFLLLFYTGCTLHFIVWTMFPTVVKSSMVETPFLTMFLVFFGWFLGMFFTTLVTLFWFFHIWLISKALTTIEYCEKSAPKDGSSKQSYDSSAYTLGFLGNLRAILGTNILLAPLPVASYSGDGLNFVSDETRLSKDFNSTKALRKKGHRPAQRAVDRARRSGYGAFQSPRSGSESWRESSESWRESHRQPD